MYINVHVHAADVIVDSICAVCARPQITNVHSAKHQSSICSYQNRFRSAFPQRLRP